MKPRSKTKVKALHPSNWLWMFLGFLFLAWGLSHISHAQTKKGASTTAKTETTRKPAQIENGRGKALDFEDKFVESIEIDKDKTGLGTGRTDFDLMRFKRPHYKPELEWMVSQELESSP